MARLVLAVILAAFAAIYLFVSVRDTAGDLKVIFEPRLIKRLRRFSIARLCGFVGIAAVYFAIVKTARFGLVDAFLVALLIAVVIAAGKLLWVAARDLFEPFVPRSLPEELDVNGLHSAEEKVPVAETTDSNRFASR